MRLAVAATLLILGLTSQALAAVGIGGFTYDVSIPATETREYTSKASFRGIGIEARWFRSPNTALGFTWHWNVFHEAGGGTWEIENGHVTGHNFRRIYASPLLLTYYYQWGSVEYGASPLWYVGLGGGAHWIEKRLEVGTGIYQTTNWHFGVCPEAGVYYSLSFNAYLHVGVKYNYALKSGENTSQSYLSLTLGIAWAR